ncbi:MAG TPA: universal stress protein [Methylomirabilota bacterium]|nr:universal stress protein [Methylomirabilota bacterium]
MPARDRTPVVFATDFSAASRSAFRAAVDLATQGGRPLRVVHAHVPPSPFVGTTVPVSWVSLERAARRAERRALARTVNGARRRGARARGEIVEGPAAEAIVRAARRAGAGVIVIGMRGRTGMRRWLMGSVAGRVLRLARIPVLSLRPRGRMHRPPPRRA